MKERQSVCLSVSMYEYAVYRHLINSIDTLAVYIVSIERLIIDNTMPMDDIDTVDITVIVIQCALRQSQERETVMQCNT